MQATEKQANAIFNKNLGSFFIRLLLVVSAWFVLYNLLLKPGRVIDRPLTNAITAASVKFINLLPGNESLTWVEDQQNENRNFLVKEGKNVMGIMDACNGIDLMFIYVGVIILLPVSAKRKLYFSAGGIVAIILADILRVASLYYIYVYYRSAFHFSHHYFFTILMYAMIFYGWLLFIKKKAV
ncbi:MAG: hypothetical protein RL172_2670 [Bacteroidota bacterium]|jgi:exosortase/archaeosortase family protein